jgi:hypothetical protein
MTDYRKIMKEALVHHGFAPVTTERLLKGYEEMIIAVRDEEVQQLRAAVAELAQAIRLTREYVGEELLPPVEGWSWYDALRRWAPHELSAAHDDGAAQLIDQLD